MTDDETYDQAVAEAQGLGLMSGAIATDRCRCPTCGEVFSTEGNFDRHLAPGRNACDYDGPWCLPPTDGGLIRTSGDGGTCRGRTSPTRGRPFLARTWNLRATQTARTC